MLQLLTVHRPSFSQNMCWIKLRTYTVIHTYVHMYAHMYTCSVCPLGQKHTICMYYNHHIMCGDIVSLVSVMCYTGNCFVVGYSGGKSIIYISVVKKSGDIEEVDLAFRG